MTILDRRRRFDRHHTGRGYEPPHYGLWKQSSIDRTRYFHVAACQTLDQAEHWARVIGLGLFIVSDQLGEDVAEFAVVQGRICGLGCN